jgi:hypothetical protein
MKSRLFVLLAMLGAALSVVPAQAQIGIRDSVNIPFDFSVGNTPLKAGMYTVKEAQPGVLAISSIDGQQNTFVLTFRSDSNNHSQQPHLVFMRYGSGTFLDKVFLSADNDYDQLPRNSREKEVVRQQRVGGELSLLIQPER